MDTGEVAEAVGTTPRILRQFLRSRMSTFVSVGSGSRYEFEDRDLPTIIARFADWSKAGKPKAMVPAVKKRKPSKAIVQKAKDKAMWEEEGHVELEDIRDPRVRRRVRQAAREAEQRLEMLLMSKGMHVSQRGDYRR
jgi:hypothetical protein